MPPLPTFRPGMSWPDVSRTMNQIATQRDGEYCGVPLPLPGLGLTVAPGYPEAQAARLRVVQEIMDSGDPVAVARAAAKADQPGSVVLNRWHSSKYRGDVLLWQDAAGKRDFGIVPDKIMANQFLLGSMSTLDAWDLDTELTACEALAEMLTERMFKCYVLTGQFLETSKRSGLTYLFRRLRPTVVLTPHKAETEMGILCALCLHPLAYYASTRCGAMVPTDDVIAHLTMMRADEHLYWKRSNQHPAIRPEAALW